MDEPRLLLVVEDAFATRGSGTQCMPRIVVTSASRDPIPIRLRLPTGEERDARAVLETAHLRGPGGSFAMYKILDVTPEEVPKGTEIWSVGAPTPATP